MKYRWIILLSILSIGYIGNNDDPFWDQYLGNSGRTAYIECIAPDSPEILWEITLEGEIQHPYIYNNNVIVLTIESPYFGNSSEDSNKDNLFIIDLLTGLLLMNINPKEGLKGAYPIGNEIVLGGTLGKLWEIDLSTQKVSFISRIPTKTSCLFGSNPLITSDFIIFPFIPVTSISRHDYQIRWDLSSSLGSNFPGGGEIRAIAASSDKVFLLMQEGVNMKVWAVNSHNGEFMWKSHDIPLCNQIAVNGSIIIAGGNGLVALDTETGEILWILEEKILSNIVITTDEAYFTDNTQLYAIDIISGKQKWQSPWDSLSFWITYVIGADNAVICSDVRNLTCFSREDGSQLWNMHFQDFIDGSVKKPCPAITNGIIIIAGEMGNNTLLAIASDPHLFAQQGDAFLSRELPDKAVESYRKAGELYEKVGNHEKAQEMKEKISRLESSPEFIIPSTSSYEYAVILVSGVLIVSILVYMLAIQKRSQ